MDLVGAARANASAVTLSEVTKTFPGAATPAIDDLSFNIEPGELVVLLGPSGCGKTTTLRCVAGLEHPQRGTIELGGRRVVEPSRRPVPPAKRNLGMVFQSYALWPHKTVAGNIGYPLRARRMDKDLTAGWVTDVARLVGCQDLLDRYPSQLSGGQQQRVALARGLVARPDVVLFDEPLSNLDAKLRDQVRGELHALHRRLGFTSIYVTHDQVEALALGHRIAVMRAGRIEQIADPRVVFDAPASEFVADFVGYATRVVLARSSAGWSTSSGPARGLEPRTDASSVVLRARPEDLGVTAVDDVPSDRFVVQATVIDASFAGRSTDVLADAGGAVLRASVRHAAFDERLAVSGSPVAVTFDPSLTMVFDEDGAPAVVEWARPKAAARNGA